MFRRFAWMVGVCFFAIGPWSAFGAEVCRGPVGGKEGNCAPDFVLKTLDGKQVQLSSLRGQVVFLNFWATWCPPCTEEIPEMEKLKDALGRERFTMLAVSIDTGGAKTIQAYFQKNFGGKPPSFPILLDQNKKVSEAYGTFKVPETYVIDPTGRIRDKIQGVRDWNDSLLVHYFTLLSERAR